jgi:Tfp pilus assembly protein PilF
VKTHMRAAYVELGYSLFKTGDNTGALANFDKALSLNSKNENARFYAGLVYISQKNKAKAQQMVDELKILNSKNATLLQERVNKM